MRVLTKPERTPGVINMVFIALASLFFVYKVVLAWKSNLQTDVFIWLGLLFMASGIQVYLYRVTAWDGHNAKEGYGHGH